MLNKIQSQLLKEHPELQLKQNLFEYYVSLELPEKQRKLIEWWQTMIECAIRKSGDFYLSPAHLEHIFTLHGLKPVPLQRVLQHLAATGRILWEGRQKDSKENTKGWLGSIVSIIWKSRVEEVPKSGYQSMSAQQCQKVICLNFKHQLEECIKSTIEREIGEESSISFEFVLSKLKHELPVGMKSIEYLLEGLQKEQWLLIDQVQEKKIIMRSPHSKHISTEPWVEVEKSKFLLKSAIQLFDAKIERRLKQEDQKLKQAKVYLELETPKAKKLLAEVRTMRKLTDEYENRRKLLKQTLDSLQINMMNSMTVNAMTECQGIVQKTMVDTAEFERIKEKQLEITLDQREFNSQLQSLSGMDDAELQDEVEGMLAQLERELQDNKLSPSKISDHKLKTQEQQNLN